MFQPIALETSSVNLVQNAWGTFRAWVWGQKFPSGVQGRSLGRGPGGRSPPEAETILDFYMHNFDLILNYFSPHSKFWGDVSPVTPKFAPLLETLGPINESAVQFLNDLGHKITSVSTDD